MLKYIRFDFFLYINSLSLGCFDTQMKFSNTENEKHTSSKFHFKSGWCRDSRVLYCSHAIFYKVEKRRRTNEKKNICITASSCDAAHQKPEIFHSLSFLNFPIVIISFFLFELVVLIQIFFLLLFLLHYIYRWRCSIVSRLCWCVCVGVFVDFDVVSFFIFFLLIY